MIALIKKCLDSEFAANEIHITARVREYAWQSDIPIKYQVDLFYGETRKVMTIIMDALPPFTPKLMPDNYIEPHKMIRLCEIILEAYKEIGRLSSYE